MAEAALAMARPGAGRCNGAVPCLESAMTMTIAPSPALPAAPCRAMPAVERGAPMPHDAVPALLSAALDQLDCGIALLTPELALMHVNRAGRLQLLEPDPAGARPRLRLNGDALRRSAALARSGRRQLLQGVCGSDAAPVALVPLADAGGAVIALLLVAGRPSVCGPAVLGLFGHAHALTLAETQVLQGLIDGQAPSAIARRSGVAECTTRTHVANLRAKTGTQSIGDLLRRLARLPPLASVLG